ncbi:GMC family oxidoreductase [Amycolatopsis sp. NPDC098790]|uniref:GMC family oxidoreductase n=1 Tax=Amycolatopsis sp. NPDC098790 TaxID=3363939 RepID=UPI003825F3E9
MTSADVIVVGAGTAGCVVAARLARAGRSVIVLEAGPDYGPSPAGWPADLLDAASLPTSHDWGFHGFGAGGRRLEYERAKVVGGCSSHNGCTQTAGWGPDYDRWPAENGVGWSAAELGPLFDRVAGDMAFQHYAPHEVQPFHRAFLEACAASGLPLVDDFGDLDGAQGAGCPPANAVDGVRRNTSFSYLDDARSQPGFTIIDRAEVTRVLLEGDRATHVEYVRDGSTSTVRGNEIVLCAGAYGSPVVLQRSGIGDPDRLRAAGIEPLVALPGVGRNLHDHPAAQIVLPATALLRDRLEEFGRQRWLPEEQSVAKLRSPRSRGPYDLHVYPWVEADDGGWSCVFPVGLLTPRSRGSVSVVSGELGDQPVIDSAFFSDADGDDIAAVRFGIRWTLDLLSHKRMSELVGPPSTGTPSRKTSDDELDAWIRASHTHYWHPAGTCRLGAAGDPLAVVDHQARVLGVRGLRVADASLFPEIPRATPAWPTAVAGERVAQLMLG